MLPSRENSVNQSIGKNTAPYENLTYFPNTQQLVFDVAELCHQIVSLYSQHSPHLKPVIMIDGPAGTGKTTFTRQLISCLRSSNVDCCYFEQDLFGLDRKIRSEYKIGACNDLSRDPRTVDKLIQTMNGDTTLVPSYDRATGSRITDKIELQSADLIIYEGVSSLSYVIYENPKFNLPEYIDSVPLKIFFQAQHDNVIYASRHKRDIHERGADPFMFKDHWPELKRDNWLYTMRGIVHANLVITRDINDQFTMSAVTPIGYLNHEIVPKLSVDRTLVANVVAERKRLIEAHPEWFEGHFQSMYWALQYGQETAIRNMISAYIFLDLAALKTQPETLSVRREISAVSHHSSECPQPPRHTMDDCLSMRDNMVIKNLYRDIELLEKNNLVRRSLDTNDLATFKKFPRLFSAYLLHDKNFNNRWKISLENSLAAVLTDNIHHFMPSVMYVSSTLAKHFKILVSKLKSCEDLVEKIELQRTVDFFLAPFKSTTFEIGRMPEENACYTEDEQILWLLQQLHSDHASSFYTHMRFHVRFMHLAAQGEIVEGKPLQSSGLFLEDFAERTALLKRYYLHGRDDRMFSMGKTAQGHDVNRGRSKYNRKTMNSPTPHFGVASHANDMFRLLRPFTGRRELQNHVSGKEIIRPNVKSVHNQLAFDADLPLVASGSGAMNFLMCAAKYANLSADEMLRYHLACLAHLIGGGHHSLTECVAVSQLFIKEFARRGTGIDSLIPESLKGVIPALNELIALTNDNPTFQSMWVVLDVPNVDDEDVSAADLNVVNAAYVSEDVGVEASATTTVSAAGAQRDLNASAASLVSASESGQVPRLGRKAN